MKTMSCLPAGKELFADVIYVATLTYEIRDPNLDAEVGNSLDQDEAN